MKNFKDLLKILSEENGAAPAAPANSVSGGGIYGVRGNPDEAVVNQAAHLKRVKQEEQKKKIPRKMVIAATGRNLERSSNVGRDGY